jgi:hypothetical protein
MRVYAQNLVKGQVFVHIGTIDDLFKFKAIVWRVTDHGCKDLFGGNGESLPHGDAILVTYLFDPLLAKELP